MPTNPGLTSCPIGVYCPGTSNPVSNFSSEEADFPAFLALAAPGLTIPGGDPTLGSTNPPNGSPLVPSVSGGGGGGAGPLANPPLGTTPNQYPCVGTAASTASQDNANAGAAANSANCASAPPPTVPLTLKASKGAGCENAPFTGKKYTLSGTNSTGTYTFSLLSGNLPPGVTLIQTSNNTAGLSGTPTQAGQYSFTVQAQVNGLTPTQMAFNPTTHTATLLDTVYVMALSNGTMVPDTQADTGFAVTLNFATVSQAYSEQLGVTGANGAATFSVDPVMIPGWITVSSSGSITGTPDLSDAGIDFYFDVTMSDANGNSCTQTVMIPVKCDVVCSSPGPPSKCPPDGTVCTFYTCVFSSVPSPIGTVYSGSLPPGLDIDASTGIVSGYPTEKGAGNFDITATLPNGGVCTGSFTNSIASDGEVSARSVSAMGAWNLTTSQDPDGGIINPPSGMPPVGGVYTIGVGGSIHGTYRRRFVIGLSRCLNVPDYPLTCSINCTFTPDPPPPDPFRSPPGPITVGYPPTVTCAFLVISQTVFSVIGSTTGFSGSAVLNGIPLSNMTNDNCAIDVQFGGAGQDSHGNDVPVGFNCTISVSITPANPP